MSINEEETKRKRKSKAKPKENLSSCGLLLTISAKASYPSFPKSPPKWSDFSELDSVFRDFKISVRQLALIVANYAKFRGDFVLELSHELCKIRIWLD